jgi:UDP-GlcNAc3NAcA epimerase
MKIVSVVGARPQFIKAAPVSKAFKEAGHNEILVHTGQHYDYGMSQVFFDELNISEPDINLKVGSGHHGWQTGQMLMRIEELLMREEPNWVLVYGDTNSTISGALAAVKLQIPLAHVEAGLRSFNREMPEEHNRVLTDHCSDVLLCPTRTAVDNLAKEAITRGVNLVGDTMYDAVLQFAEIAKDHSKILQALGLKEKEYLLATLHRPYNTDVPANLNSILSAFIEIEEPIVFSVHPRTRQKIASSDNHLNSQLESSGVKVIDPVGYLDMLVLEQHARLVLTDSGGMQKEAYFFKVPCITLRPETEWVETVEEGWNVVVGSNPTSIVEKAHTLQPPPQSQRQIFGKGHASELIVRTLENAGQALQRMSYLR